MIVVYSKKVPIFRGKVYHFLNILLNLLYNSIMQWLLNRCINTWTGWACQFIFYLKWNLAWGWRVSTRVKVLYLHVGNPGLISLHHSEWSLTVIPGISSQCSWVWPKNKQWNKIILGGYCVNRLNISLSERKSRSKF